MATLTEIQQKISECPAVGLYITAPNCGVCIALKPKLKALMEQKFPQVIWEEANAEAQPAIPAYFQTFVVPTFIIFLDGKEFLRRARSVGLDELSSYLQRPYYLLFDE